MFSFSDRVLLFCLAFLFCPVGAVYAAPPEVIASIKPIHALAAKVMAGRGVPVLLIDRANSPHTYKLRPSQARQLSKADLVFRISARLEFFLDKAVANLAPQARLVDLIDVPGLKRYPRRQSRSWQDDEHAYHAHVIQPELGAPDWDPHIWLDVQNARLLAQAITEALVKLDSEGAELYRANARVLDQELQAFDKQVRNDLAPVARRAFIVFHDAYRYLEEGYGLLNLGSFTIVPDRLPGAQKMRALRQMIARNEVVCLFSEPQFSSKLVASIIEDTGLRAGQLDPLGAGIEAGPQAYFQIIKNLITTLKTCLS